MGVVLINMGLKTMKEPGKPMKVMKSIKVGLLLEPGSNEIQPGKPSIKRYESYICVICKEFLVKKRKAKKERECFRIYIIYRSPILASTHLQYQKRRALQKKAIR